MINDSAWVEMMKYEGLLPLTDPTPSHDIYDDALEVAKELSIWKLIRELLIRLPITLWTLCYLLRMLMISALLEYIYGETREEKAVHAVFCSMNSL